jgi:hypothetical protein
MAVNRTTGIDVEGLREVTRALRSLDKDLAKEFKQSVLKPAALVVVRGTHTLVPIRTGRLAMSIRANQVGAITSARPYANVIHWGGSVPSSRSTSTRPKRTFKATPFVIESFDRNEHRVLDEFDAGVARFARRTGWDLKGHP